MKREKSVFIVNIRVLSAAVTAHLLTGRIAPSRSYPAEFFDQLLLRLRILQFPVSGHIIQCVSKAGIQSYVRNFKSCFDLPTEAVGREGNSLKVFEMYR